MDQERTQQHEGSAAGVCDHAFCSEADMNRQGWFGEACPHPVETDSSLWSFCRHTGPRVWPDWIDADAEYIIDTIEEDAETRPSKSTCTDHDKKTGETSSKHGGTDGDIDRTVKMNARAAEDIHGEKIKHGVYYTCHIH